MKRGMGGGELKRQRKRQMDVVGDREAKGCRGTEKQRGVGGTVRQRGVGEV